MVVAAVSLFAIAAVAVVAFACGVLVGLRLAAADVDTASDFDGGDPWP